ncbi:hypothetical protein RUM44_004590 [Polyplax serrata]|uniref:Uncharacterized protein n=1 Tax=Polyplax serrata TaxID=468196 RepID=A0ABR1B3A5_POLSC
MCGVRAAAAAAAEAEASVEDHESREEKMEKFNMETSNGSPDPRGTCQQKTKKKKRKGLGDEGQFPLLPDPFTKLRESP